MGFSRRVKQVSWIEKHVCWRSSSPKYSKAGLVWKNLSHVVSWTPNYCMQCLLPLPKGRLTCTRPIGRIPDEFSGGNQSWSLLWTVSWYISPLITILMRLFIRSYHPFEPAWQIHPQASRSKSKKEGIPSFSDALFIAFEWLVEFSSSLPPCSQLVG